MNQIWQGVTRTRLPPIFPLILFLVALLLTGCGDGEMNKITLKLEAMRFQQDHIQVKTGQPVTLHLVNKDGYTHAFDLDEFDIHLQLAAEETAELTFTPTRSGSFTFYCSSPGHRSAGMEGSITVTP
jgi:uncharacterized cupredoxin-like copper-binding protein